MAMTIQELDILLKSAFPEAAITIKDLAGDGDHYQTTIISERFQGLSKIQQHKMVYAAFQGKMGLDLHALSLTTHAPSAIKESL